MKRSVEYHEDRFIHTLVRDLVPQMRLGNVDPREWCSGIEDEWALFHRGESTLPGSIPPSIPIREARIARDILLSLVEEGM